MRGVIRPAANCPRQAASSWEAVPAAPLSQRQHLSPARHRLPGLGGNGPSAADGPGPGVWATARAASRSLQSLLRVPQGKEQPAGRAGGTSSSLSLLRELDTRTLSDGTRSPPQLCIKGM